MFSWWPWKKKKAEDPVVLVPTTQEALYVVLLTYGYSYDMTIQVYAVSKASVAVAIQAYLLKKHKSRSPTVTINQLKLHKEYNEKEL